MSGTFRLISISDGSTDSNRIHLALLLINYNKITASITSGGVSHRIVFIDDNLSNIIYFRLSQNSIKYTKLNDFPVMDRWN